MLKKFVLALQLQIYHKKSVKIWHKHVFIKIYTFACTRANSNKHAAHSHKYVQLSAFEYKEAMCGLLHLYKCLDFKYQSNIRTETINYFGIDFLKLQSIYLLKNENFVVCIVCILFSFARCSYVFCIKLSL